MRTLGPALDDSGATLDGNFNRSREVSPADDVLGTFRFPIPNDDFGNAQLLTGLSGSVSSSNRFTFQESDEPINIFGDAQQYGSSVWYQWTPPEPGGWASFDLTAGTAFDSLLAVSTGERLDSLMLVAANDN